MTAESLVAPAQFDLGDVLARPYRADEAPFLLAAVRESIESVGRWLPWCHAGYSDADSIAWIAHCLEAWKGGDHFTFGVFDAVELVGAVGLNHRNREHNFVRSATGCARLAGAMPSRRA